jgi:hypothetical protein
MATSTRNNGYYTMKIGDKIIERGYLIDYGLINLKLNKNSIEEKLK